MIRESQIAVVARNETGEGEAATEPYEAGWATEAVVFVRALAFTVAAEPWRTDSTIPGSAAVPRVEARVQISADGMRWIDEGQVFELPRDTARDCFVRVRHFGNWLRIAAELPEGLAVKVLVTIHVK